MGASGYIGSPTGNVIVPVSNFTKRTKEIALTTADVVAGTNVSSITAAAGSIICYADSLGNWKAKGNLQVNATMASSSLGWEISLQYLSFPAFTQEVGVVLLQNTIPITGGVAVASSSTVKITASSSSSPGSANMIYTFDVMLASEPTTYTTAANLEGNVNVAAYFPNAIPGTTAGIVPTAGLPGNITGSVPGAGTIGEISMVGTVRNGTGGLTYSTRGTATVTGTYTAVASITLNIGVYLVSYQLVCNQASQTHDINSYLAIGTTQITNIQDTSFPTGEWVTQTGCLPIVITANSTVVGLYAHIASGVSAASATEEIWAVRIG